jgi:demethylmenaquinone methyltransferase / 2-methoxy-6-polyprenyl-1,4-benzoquinol methylase
MQPPEPSTVIWDSSLLANPHSLSDKPSRVRRMFAAIAPSYDLNNRLHSLGMDQRWRRRAAAMSRLRPGDTVLDVACGTGDLALRFAAELERLGGGQVMGLDFTYEMLPLARAKAFRKERNINWINGDALSLPLPDASVDVVSIAFGIRNVADPLRALRQFHRILKPGGRLVVLEFSLPQSRALRALYNFYFRRVLPVTATLVSGDRTGAYKYLPESVNTFISRDEMLRLMESAGFAKGCARPLTLGICVCYVGEKAAYAKSPD